jgi:hypothetical protein
VVTLFFRQDVDFSSFFSLFSTLKKTPKWPKNGAPSWSLGEHQNDHDKHTCEVASSSAYVYRDYFERSYGVFISEWQSLPFNTPASNTAVALFMHSLIPLTHYHS